MNPRTRLTLLAVVAACSATASTWLEAAPVVRRLTPPSALFSYAISDPPITARFLPGQRFDLQATVAPDAGKTITSVRFFVDGRLAPGTVAISPATAAGLPADTVSAALRAFSVQRDGVHLLRVEARQSDGAVTNATGNFEIVAIDGVGPKTKNIIVLIGDGMGIAHRTAARLMLNGVTQGKSDAPLAMDTLPHVALVTTHSLNSIVTDSSPGASCYSTGNKGNNNQHGVFPDDTVDNFDNPRVENIATYLHRTQAKALGIVTTSDVFDATPAAFASHTQNRAAGTGICDQYLDERETTGLAVLLGGGRKWFLPQGTPGSARTSASNNDYVLPADAASAWGVPAGAIDPTRNLLGDFQAAGFTYAANAAQLEALPGNTRKLLGLFALSNMNVALDKINGRRGAPGADVVADYGFPDQPMLDEMTGAALDVLRRYRGGFVLMVEGASIDKQAHNMDTERWILDTIEFDRAVAVCRDFALRERDTVVIVTADHECAGVNIIGASTVTQAVLQTRAGAGGGVAGLRDTLVGNYDAAGFPRYTIAPDGYPEATDIDRRMLVGYAANADRYEDWLTDALPLRDSQQPFNGSAPLSLYPNGPLDRDAAGGFFVTGQVPGTTAVHTASDIPLSALGRGASRFAGVMDNTEIFFELVAAAVEGAQPDVGRWPEWRRRLRFDDEWAHGGR